jgi:hypothetical protein
MKKYHLFAHKQLVSPKIGDWNVDPNNVLNDPHINPDLKENQLARKQNPRIFAQSRDDRKKKVLEPQDLLEHACRVICIPPHQCEKQGNLWDSKDDYMLIK